MSTGWARDSMIAYVVQVVAIVFGLGRGALAAAVGEARRRTTGPTDKGVKRMDVQRAPNQSGTLREFYTECLAWGGHREEIGYRMLALLDHLAATAGPPLLGLTSHHALHLFPAAGEPGPCVIVHSYVPGYFVDPSDAKNSWKGGYATDATTAVELVLAGLGASGSSDDRVERNAP